MDGKTLPSKPTPAEVLAENLKSLPPATPPRRRRRARTPALTLADIEINWQEGGVTRRRRRRVLMLSSPTLRGATIDTWYHRGDQRRFYVPCPACGHMHVLAWANVHWTDEDPATAHLVCPGCAHAFGAAERVAILGRGEWRLPGAVVASRVQFALALHSYSPRPSRGRPGAEAPVPDAPRPWRASVPGCRPAQRDLERDRRCRSDRQGRGHGGIAGIAVPHQAGHARGRAMTPAEKAVDTRNHPTVGLAFDAVAGTRRRACPRPRAKACRRGWRALAWLVRHEATYQHVLAAAGVEDSPARRAACGRMTTRSLRALGHAIQARPSRRGAELLP